MRLLPSLVSVIGEALSTVTSRERLASHLRAPLHANAYFLMANAVSISVAGFFFWVTAARLYTPENVGLASASLSAILLLASLCTLGFEFGLIRFLPGAGARARELLNTGFTFVFLTSLIASLIFLAGLKVWSPSLSFLHRPALFVSFALFTTVSTLSHVLDRAFVARRQARFAFWRTLIMGTTQLLFLVALAPLAEAFGIIGAVGVASTLALGVAVVGFLRLVEGGYLPTIALSKGVIREVLPYSFDNYLAAFLWSGPSWVLPLLVVRILGAETNAYFYIAWGIGVGVFLIPTAISLSLFAEGSHQEDQLTSNMWSSLKLSCLLLLPAIVLAFLIGDKLLLIFGREYSLQGSLLLRLLALASPLVTVNSLYFSYLRVRKETKRLIWLSAAVATVFLGLNFLLMPWLRLGGIGLSFLIAQGMLAIPIALLFARRH